MRNNISFPPQNLQRNRYPNIPISYFCSRKRAGKLYSKESDFILEKRIRRFHEYKKTACFVIDIMKLRSETSPRKTTDKIDE